MKTRPEYRTLPERGFCLHAGCSWHREGPSAQPLAEAHAKQTSHVTYVACTATVTYRPERMMQAVRL